MSDAPARPDVVLIMTDQERAIPPYESDEVRAWRRRAMPGTAWFDDHAVRFDRHYTGSLACVPSRPTLFTGQFPDVHGVTQTDGLGKMADDSRMRWLRMGEVPTLGNWFRAAGYDTHYDGKWHLSHADLHHADGSRVVTNDDEGHVDAVGVRAYLDAEPLEPYGFSGWVGPEPHGGDPADSGLVRDALIAQRCVEWLEDRYARRRAGETDALRPFLLVASFVNPHDIVFWPMWAARGTPFEPGPNDPPAVPPSPTDDEDLSTKPASQIAFRDSYFSCYGPAPAVARQYRSKAQAYRNTYYRLHAEVDGPLDRVRRAVTDSGSDALLVRTADHGELLGAHGGLHQKWFNLYDEATRIPLWIARVGQRTTGARQIEEPTSHVDLVPTLLAAAGADVDVLSEELCASHSEVHPLPGRDLLPVVDGGEPDPERAVYLLTRDNMPEGDSGASGLARRLGRIAKTPAPLTIQVPAHVAANFEGLVTRVTSDVPGGEDHLWKLVRSFDDPATWTEPGRRHLAATGPGGAQYRSEPLDDQWELYDLDTDPVEAVNRSTDLVADEVFQHLRRVLKEQRAASVPERNEPWPYAARNPAAGPPAKTPPRPVRGVRRLLQRVGMHPDDPKADDTPTVTGRALVVCTNHGVLDIGKPTGVFASEMTAPYYVFTDAGLDVDLASPRGGVIPVDPQSLRAPLRTEHDDRFLADEDFKAKVTDSLPIDDLDMADYDIVFLAGGWGAAFDFHTSEELSAAITEANRLERLIGGVCHGPLALCNATSTDGRPLVEGRRVTGVTDKQVTELGIGDTPYHPETELRRAGALFESETRFRDPFANHWVVDGNLVTGQNQNAGPMVARELVQLLAAVPASDVGDRPEVATTS